MSQLTDPVLPLAARRSHTLSGNLLAMFGMVAWTLGFPAAEILLQSWPPLTLVAVRLVLITAALLPLWMLVDGPRAVINARWGYGLFVGGLAFGIGSFFLVLAQDLTDVVTVAIIASTCPLASVIIEMVWEKRRLSKSFAFGLMATLIGGIVATGGGSVALGLGALSATVSCFLFSWGSYLTVRDFPKLSPLGRTTLTLAGGALATCALTLALQAGGQEMRPSQAIDSNQIAILLFYALIGLALSQVLWIASVERIGVALASFHINITPFYAMLIMLALGAAWNWQAAFGAAIVAVGVIVAQRESKPA